jgi:sarcosine oxidase subunit gamma
MADLASRPARRSALEGHYAPGDFGAIHDGLPGIILQERRGLAIVHIDAWAGKAEACAEAVAKACGVTPGMTPCTAAESGETAALWIGPNRWLVVEPETRDLFAALKGSVGEDLAALTDLGHSRVCWRITGPRLRDLLVKGSTIDFDRFGVADSINTQMGHFAVTLHGRGADTADLYAARSFAADMHHWLHESALEFGLRVAEPA